MTAQTSGSSGEGVTQRESNSNAEASTSGTNSNGTVDRPDGVDLSTGEGGRKEASEAEEVLSESETSVEGEDSSEGEVKTEGFRWEGHGPRT